MAEALESVAGRSLSAVANAALRQAVTAEAHRAALLHWVCANSDAAVVVTTDPGDIIELASATPGTRVVVRSPSLLRASA